MIRFISYCINPVKEAKFAVNNPSKATTRETCGALLKITEDLKIRKTPAVTIVALCKRAETGVGPSIASVTKDVRIIS